MFVRFHGAGVVASRDLLQEVADVPTAAVVVHVGARTGGPMVSTELLAFKHTLDRMRRVHFVYVQGLVEVFLVYRCTVNRRC